MVQYHALGLLYHLKSKDRGLGVQKLVVGQMKGTPSRSPYACCLLIRYASKVRVREPVGRMSVYPVGRVGAYPVGQLSAW